MACRAGEVAVGDRRIARGYSTSPAHRQDTAVSRLSRPAQILMTRRTVTAPIRNSAIAFSHMKMTSCRLTPQLYDVNHPLLSTSVLNAIPWHPSISDYVEHATLYSQQRDYVARFPTHLFSLSLSRLPIMRSSPSSAATKSYEVFCVTSGYHHDVDDNCAILGHYTASSSNFSPMFRYNLSVPSSRVNWPLKMGPFFLSTYLCE